MTAALAGKILGRLFLSYLIVWMVMLIIAGFKFSKASKHVHSWYGFIILTLLFLFGIASHLVSKGMI